MGSSTPDTTESRVEAPEDRRAALLESKAQLELRIRTLDNVVKYKDIAVASRVAKVPRRFARTFAKEAGVTLPECNVYTRDIYLDRVGYWARPAEIQRRGMLDVVYVVHTVGFTILGVRDTIEQCTALALSHDKDKVAPRDVRDAFDALRREANKHKEELSYVEESLKEIDSEEA